MSVYVSAPTPARHIITDERGIVSEHVTAHLALTATAPRQARRLLGIALAEWGLGDLADAADLITSELVTNAVIHGHEPALLNLYTDREDDSGLLFIEVEDASADVPEPCEPDGDSIGGRGLLLVEALAEDWGVEPAGSGKRVWASLRITSGAGRAQSGSTAV